MLPQGPPSRVHPRIKNRPVTVSAAEMCALAGRLNDGRVTAADLRLAERLLFALAQVLRLQADSSIEVP
jgi:hypothetical protein